MQQTGERAGCARMDGECTALCPGTQVPANHFHCNDAHSAPARHAGALCDLQVQSLTCVSSVRDLLVLRDQLCGGTRAELSMPW